MKTLDHITIKVAQTIPGEEFGLDRVRIVLDDGEKLHVRFFVENEEWLSMLYAFCIDAYGFTQGELDKIVIPQFPVVLEVKNTPENLG